MYPFYCMVAWINKGYLKYKYFKETILLINWLVDSCMQYKLGLQLLTNIPKKQAQYISPTMLHNVGS